MKEAASPSSIIANNALAVLFLLSEIGLALGVALTVSSAISSPAGSATARTVPKFRSVSFVNTTAFCTFTSARKVSVADTALKDTARILTASNGEDNFILSPYKKWDITIFGLIIIIIDS